jgi:hypothetical protein
MTLAERIAAARDAAQYRPTVAHPMGGPCDYHRDSPAIPLRRTPSTADGTGGWADRARNGTLPAKDMTR